MRHGLLGSSARLMQRVVFMATVFACSWMTMAQPDSANPPTLPQPGTVSGQKVWVSMVISFILFAAVMLVSLKPGKRGHQD